MRRPHALAPLVLVAVLVMAGCENQILDRIIQDVQAAKAANAPTVTQTNPEADAQNVATDGAIWATFSVPVDGTTVTEDSFLLTKAAVAVEGEVSYDAELNRAIFTPAEALELTTTYTATLTTDIENADGIAMAAEYSWEFTTYAANPDEIVVNLSYLGPYELSATYPVFLRFYPDPLVIEDPESGFAGLLHTVKTTSMGPTVVSVDDLPASDSGAWALEILHDLNGNYETLGGPDGLDVSAFYVDNGGSNVTTNEMDVLVTFYPDPVTFTEEAHVEAGNAYALEFSDPPLVEADSAEPDDDWTTAKAVDLFAVATRTLDWDNSDWISFVAPRWDDYRVVVVRDPYNPDDVTSLDLEFNVRLVVYKYDSGSANIYHVGTDADGSYGLVDAYMEEGETYLFEVTGVEPYDTGEYKLKVIYAEALADEYEEDDAADVPDPGIPDIAFGPAGTQVRTAQKFDSDFMHFTLPASGLSADVGYAVVITKPLGSVRDLAFTVDIRGYAVPTTGYGQVVDSAFPTLIRNLAVWGIPGFYIRVLNASTSTVDYFQPTGGYEIAVITGPDSGDYDINSGTELAVGDQNDAWDAAPSPLSVGVGPQMRSIWPAGDVDWLALYWDDGVYPGGLRFAVTGPTEGADDLKVQMEFYDEEDGSLTSKGLWDFGGAATYDLVPGPFTLPGMVYIKVWKSGYEPNKATGAYAVDVTEIL